LAHDIQVTVVAERNKPRSGERRDGV
jgi:hypothetical protein